MAQSKPQLLSEATTIWQSCQAEFKEGELRDGTIVPPEELKKVAKWLQQTTTKFGASAAVADGATDKAMAAVSEELTHSFTAAIQTLVCLSRGAGASLLAEVRDVGSSLSTAVAELGAAAGTSQLAVAAGKVLDRVKSFERTSAHNRAAIRKRLLRSLSQIRDAQRELQEALQAGVTKAEGGGEDDFDDFLGSEPEMEPGERHLVEAIAGAVEVLLEVLKQASQLCVPGNEEAPLAVLEASAQHGENAAQAVDGLAVHAIGGIDIASFKASLADLRVAAGGFEGWHLGASGSLPAVLERVQVAIDAVPPS